MSPESSMAQTWLRGSGLLTGWGAGLHRLPPALRAATIASRYVPVATPVLDNDRLRRATRECLLGVAVTEVMLRDSHLSRDLLTGPQTALIFASASSYMAANWQFVVGGTESALHFPYTAPSAVPGEVTIQFSITGPYVTFLSGTNAGLEALWYAATLLQAQQCTRVLVLGVETFAECLELFTAGRWLLSLPLVETAACLLLESHAALAAVSYHAGDTLSIVDTLSSERITTVYLCLPTAREDEQTRQYLQARWPSWCIIVLRERVGTVLACAPLIALMLSCVQGQQGDILCISRWWDTWAVLRWPAGAR
jgi:hypothetical protein